MNIRGSGGKGGGHTPVEDPNSLFSRAYARVLDLICEGPIEGFVNGNSAPQKSVYLDNVPMMNADGTSNFNTGANEGTINTTELDFRLGTQDQTTMSNFTSVQNTTAVGGGSVTKEQSRTIFVTSGPDTIIVNLSIPQLYQYTSGGDLLQYTTYYNIYVYEGSISTTPVVSLPNQVLTGKTSSKYSWGHTFPNLNTTKGHYIKVERVGENATSTKIQDVIYFDTVTSIASTKLNYPNSALIGIKIDSEFFDSIPTRGYLLKLLKVKVPHNYDPVSRSTGASQNSSTEIRVFEGANELLFIVDPTKVRSGTWSISSVSTSGCTSGKLLPSSTIGASGAETSDHLGLAGSTGTITYNIKGKFTDGTVFTREETQTLVRGATTNSYSISLSASKIIRDVGWSNWIQEVSGMSSSYDDTSGVTYSCLSAPTNNTLIQYTTPVLHPPTDYEGASCTRTKRNRLTFTHSTTSTYDVVAITANLIQHANGTNTTFTAGYYTTTADGAVEATTATAATTGTFSLTPALGASGYTIRLYTTSSKSVLLAKTRLPIVLKDKPNSLEVYNSRVEVRVPSTEATIWNGTVTKLAWTDNPAWCFYDLLTNPRYGLGEYIDVTKIDVALLYDIATKCDELVPGAEAGTLEHRFTLNAYIQSREDALKVLNDLASTFRGMIYWSTGLISFSQDIQVENPIMQFTASNVIEGRFKYTGASRKTMHNAALVTWIDPALNYTQRVEYVTLDDTAIAKYGYNPIETVAFGCTSRGQANRVGKWLLYTDTYEGSAISFRASLEAAFLRPGMIIQVADTRRQAGSSFNTAGRVVSVTTNTVTLDRKVTLVPSKMYTLTLSSIDNTTPKILATDVNPATGQPYTHSEIIAHDTNRFSTISYTLATVPVTTELSTVTLDTGSINTLDIKSNTIWALENNDLYAEEYKIISIAETDELGIYEIAGLLHNPSKFGYIEQPNTSLTAYNVTTLDNIPELVNPIITPYSATYTQADTLVEVTTPNPAYFKVGDTIGILGYLNTNPTKLGYNQIEYYTINNVLSNSGNFTFVSKLSTVATGDPTAQTVTPTGAFTIVSKNTVMSDSIYFDRSSGNVSSKLNISFSPSEGAVSYNVVLTQWVNISTTTTPVFVAGQSTVLATKTKFLTQEVLGVTDGTYYRGRVTPFNSLGKPGPSSIFPPETVSPYIVRGKLLPPADVTNLTVQISNTGILTASWDAVPDIDLDTYELRYTSDGSTAWSTATLLATTKHTTIKIGVPVVGNLKILVKAKDKGNNESEAAIYV